MNLVIIGVVLCIGLALTGMCMMYFANKYKVPTIIISERLPREEICIQYTKNLTEGKK